MVGVAPNAKFMPVSGTSFSWRTTEEIFEYCVKNGADIISCSWGTIDPANSLNSLKEQAITRAAKQGRNGKGCIVLFAVGNDDKDFVSYYAAHPDVIAVAACTSKDEHARYSNRGRQVSICAPSNGDWPLIAARLPGIPEIPGSRETNGIGPMAVPGATGICILAAPQGLRQSWRAFAHSCCQ
ncbi:MAG: S8 family serine peptidase [Saprospirales bacterium]|nr:S8 family serine peptidase [Saprospirales bacterium]